MLLEIDCIWPGHMRYGFDIYIFDDGTGNEITLDGDYNL
jgi:hypothetical protein